MASAAALGLLGGGLLGWLTGAGGGDKSTLKLQNAIENDSTIKNAIKIKINSENLTKVGSVNIAKTTVTYGGPACTKDLNNDLKKYYMWSIMNRPMCEDGLKIATKIDANEKVYSSLRTEFASSVSENVTNELTSKFK